MAGDCIRRVEVGISKDTRGSQAWERGKCDRNFIGPQVFAGKVPSTNSQIEINQYTTRLTYIACCPLPTRDLELNQNMGPPELTRAYTGHIRDEMLGRRSCEQFTPNLNKQYHTHDAEQSARILSTASLKFARISVCLSDNLAFLSSESKEMTMYSI